MKRFLTLVLSSCFILLWQLSWAKKITPYIHSSTFLSANKPYVETCIDISGQSIIYQLNANSKFQASIDITISYKPLLKDTTLVKYEKYVLHSIELNDTMHIPFDLFNLRRVNLDNNNNYLIEVSFIDEAKPNVNVVLSQTVTLNYDTTALQLSDIALIDTFTNSTATTIYSKDGYDIQPRTFDYYPSDKINLMFYAEIYNAKKTVNNNDFLVVYTVLNSKNEPVNGLRGYSKESPNLQNLILASIDITDLPSGNYYLAVEVRDNSNTLITQKSEFFQRSNKRPVKELTNLADLKVEKTFVQRIPKDSLGFYLMSLTPTAEKYEVQYITNAMAMHDTVLTRQFIYNFWYKRDNLNPEKVFKKYMSDVYYCEYEFSTRLRHGFETDRGRVYLQYGKPDDREVYDREPSALPYERWQYYSIDNNRQSNVYFIFYNPDEVTNDYTLINSTATGEIQDDRWQYKIFNAFGPADGSNNIDNTTVPGSFGTHINSPY